MTAVVQIGCSDLPQGMGWERYFEKLSFVETSVLAQRAARPSVLARWRAAAPGPGAFSVVAPPIVANPLGIERGLVALATALDTLEASVVVFRTPASFSPSAGNRDLLRRLFGEVMPPGDRTRVWQPDGLWDVRTAVKLAGELGVVYGADPLVRDQTRDPPDLFATLETREAYFRVTGLGRGARKLATSQLDELCAAASAYERAWVLFATVDSLTDATRFRDLLGQS